MKREGGRNPHEAPGPLKLYVKLRNPARYHMLFGSARWSGLSRDLKAEVHVRHKVKTTDLNCFQLLLGSATCPHPSTFSPGCGSRLGVEREREIEGEGV